MSKEIFINLDSFKENLVGTYKNLTNNPTLQLDFEEVFNNNFFSWNQEIVNYQIIPNNLKKLQPQNSQKNFQYISIKTSLKEISNSLKNTNYRTRASLDLGCCYALYHNPILHQKLKTSIIQIKETHQDHIAVYDNFEKVRIILLAQNYYLGIVKNITDKVAEDVLSADISNLEIVLLNEFIDHQTSSSIKNFVKNIQEKIPPKIFSLVKNLQDCLDNQEYFFNKITAIIDQIINKENIPQNQESQDKNSVNTKENQNQDLENFGAESIENNLPQINEIKDQDNQISVEPPKILDDFLEVQEQSIDNGLNVVIDKINYENDRVEFKNLYKIYTNKFDEVIYPNKFTNKNELQILRDQLDLKINKLNSISKKITLKLKRKLLSKKNNHLELNESEGVLNRKKLTNIILSPQIENIWLNYKTHNYQDTILTILLDNSGSMRGNPIVMSAMACEIIAEILEKFTIRTEIIGYTTADWKGGKVRKLWESSGRIKNPGRLNELRHIIYKSYNQSFKKSKNNLGLMLKEGILKENIDGEALLFARARMMQQNSRRKILMVISDGTPVDDSTTSNNDNDILINHLHHVINIIEKQRKIEIIGIGIGHTTDDFYKNSMTIKSSDELGDAMIDKITNLL